MSGDSLPLTKLRPSQFREAVAHGGAGYVEVLVEVEAPGPSIEFHPDAPGQSFGSPRPFRIAPAKSPEAAADLRASIERIVGAKAAVPYGSSTTFVIAATFAQVREIAQLDRVKEIWPNDRSAEFGQD